MGLGTGLRETVGESAVCSASRIGEGGRQEKRCNQPRRLKMRERAGIVEGKGAKRRSRGEMRETGKAGTGKVEGGEISMESAVAQTLLTSPSLGQRCQLKGMEVSASAWGARWQG